MFFWRRCRTNTPRSIAFSGPFGSYEIEQANKFVKMAVLDCRGLEPVGFDPRVLKYLHCDITCCPPPNSSWFLVAGWMDCIGSWVRNQIWRYRSHWRRLGRLWWKGMLAEHHSYNRPTPVLTSLTSRLENQWASQTLRATSAKKNNAMSPGGSLISYILVTFFFSMRCEKRVYNGTGQIQYGLGG